MMGVVKIPAERRRRTPMTRGMQRIAYPVEDLP